jgi:hypothetical protein
MVIAKPGRQLFVPVPLERYLKTVRKSLQHDLDKDYKGAPQDVAEARKVDTRFAQLDIAEKELAGLTPEQRNAPAYYISLVEFVGAKSFIVDKTAPDARRVMMLNPDYFDKSLPRTATQLIVIGWHDAFFKGFFDTPTFDCCGAAGREYELVKGLDYKKLAGLLK